MYPSKGTGAYGQQQYSGQQAYGQISGTGDLGSQHAMASRQAMMGISQEADLSAYRTQSAQGAQYGGPYASVYGSAGLTTTHQVGGVGAKGTTSSGLQGRYPSTLPESSKFSSATSGSNLGVSADDYGSASSRAYAQKGDPYSAVKSSDYSSIERRHYSDQAAYLGRDLQNDPARRYADSVSVGQQHQTDIHDHMDQASAASLLRQQQILKAQSLQSGSDMRQTEYLAARAASIHHGSQEYSSYGARMDVDPRSLSLLGSGPYGSQHAPSILGGAPRRNVDDLYAQGSSSGAYGVGLPPGRDYVAGKGLHGSSLQPDYQALPHGHPGLAISVADERKDERSAYRRELERDEERRRELIREKEKQREREERERQRERERERERLLERRERERERERRRSSDARRERTPSRSTRDRRGSSLLKDERTPRRLSPRRVSPRRASPLRRASPRRASPQRRSSPVRRASPRRGALHRHHSPVKEKKRDYICKIYPFSLVDAERDYLSLSKRYPRLFISPECTKVVLHWPKGSLHLSLHTPVSFEHEYVELDSKGEKLSIPSEEFSRLKHGNTVWNSKVILMSGISGDVLKEMCSYKSSNDRIIHFNNILRFAILKKDHSFMAIGGPWDAVADGGDPLVEDSSLIQAARRHLKDTTQVDLQNCQHWNRFLEIHYDRIGEDGLFSHKEITVLFVPDLSECLPSLDAWKTQWLSHKKDVAERERQLAANDKKSTEKKEPEQEKVKAEDDTENIKSATTDCAVPISEKGVDAVKASDVKDAIVESNNKDMVDWKGKGHLEEKPVELNAEAAVEEGEPDVKKVIDGARADLPVEKQKPVKKKVIKKVVKVKVAGKKAAKTVVEDAAAKPDDKVDIKDEGDKEHEQENVVIKEETAMPASVKTFTRKKIVQKVPAGQYVKKVDNSADISANQTSVKPVVMEKQGDKVIKTEPDDGAAPQESGVKTPGKKKIVRRVIKRKASGTVVKSTNSIDEAGDEENIVTPAKTSKGEETKDVAVTGNSNDKMIPEEPKTQVVEKVSPAVKEEKTEDSEKDTKLSEQSVGSDKGVLKKSMGPEATKEKDTKKDNNGDSKKERTKDDKDNKSKDVKHDSKQKSSKEVKEKGKSEEPPQHPGLFLQTRKSKGSKVRSMCLSLGGLLDYNDKDVEESTFELSIFAESLNELLQYQMGCCLLSFIEKLRRRYIIKKNQRKRKRDENSEKDIEESSSLKQPKLTDESGAQIGSPKSGKKGNSQDEAMVDGGSMAQEVEPRMENKLDEMENKLDEENDVEDEGENMSDEDNQDEEEEEEDPEELIEDDQEMNDVAPSADGLEKCENVAKTDDSMEEPKKATAEEDSGKKALSSENIAPMDEKPDREKTEDDRRSETVKSDTGKEDVVDTEVLQAFRYFDHNCVGYIKVEDLRCLLHNLGKFLSHRDVKELVQSALFESNTARDNRVFYEKLVKITDL